MIDVFVISPYTDDSVAVMANRIDQANEYVAALVREGVVVYSTIAAMSHIVNVYALPGDYPFWKKHCEQMIESSKEVHVLMIDGYDTSVGVSDEIRIAIETGKPIKYIGIPIK